MTGTETAVVVFFLALGVATLSLGYGLAHARGQRQIDELVARLQGAQGALVQARRALPERAGRDMAMLEAIREQLGLAFDQNESLAVQAVCHELAVRGVNPQAIARDAVRPRGRS